VDQQRRASVKEFWRASASASECQRVVASASECEPTYIYNIEIYDVIQSEFTFAKRLFDSLKQN